MSEPRLVGDDQTITTYPVPSGFAPDVDLRRSCPHCGKEFSRPLDPAFGNKGGMFGDRVRHTAGVTPIAGQDNIYVALFGYICPACGELALDVWKDLEARPGSDGPTGGELIPAFPNIPVRPVDPAVPDEIARDYREAVAVSRLSPGGAATLARRCLQATLRAGYPQARASNLFNEIKNVVALGTLPGDLCDALDTLRQAGNLGAHPEKDGMTVVYRLSHADLDLLFHTLDWLFEEVFVVPARRAERARSASDLRRRLDG